MDSQFSNIDEVTRAQFVKAQGEHRWSGTLKQFSDWKRCLSEVRKLGDGRRILALEVRVQPSLRWEHFHSNYAQLGHLIELVFSVPEQSIDAGLIQRLSAQTAANYADAATAAYAVPPSICDESSALEQTNKFRDLRKVVGIYHDASQGNLNPSQMISLENLDTTTTAVRASILAYEITTNIPGSGASALCDQLLKNDVEYRELKYRSNIADRLSAFSLFAPADRATLRLLALSFSSLLAEIAGRRFELDRASTVAEYEQRLQFSNQIRRVLVAASDFSPDIEKDPSVMNGLKQMSLGLLRDAEPLHQLVIMPRPHIPPFTSATFTPPTHAGTDHAAHAYAPDQQASPRTGPGGSTFETRSGPTGR